MVEWATMTSEWMGTLYDAKTGPESVSASRCITSTSTPSCSLLPWQAWIKKFCFACQVGALVRRERLPQLLDRKFPVLGVDVALVAVGQHDHDKGIILLPFFGLGHAVKNVGERPEG